MSNLARKKAAHRKSAIDRLKAEFGLNDVELAYLLEATPRTLYRWMNQPPPGDYAPLKRLTDLGALARLSMKESVIAEWFHEPNRALGGSVPVRLIADPRGYQLVSDVLGAAAYGLPA